jgi:hypothetical protein
VPAAVVLPHVGEGRVVVEGHRRAARVPGPVELGTHVAVLQAALVRIRGLGAVADRLGALSLLH